MWAAIVTRGVATFMLLIALGRLPVNYYVALRIVVCAVSVYGCFIFIELNKYNHEAILEESRRDVTIWSITFASASALMAVLFNPIIPIHLDKDVWAFIDTVTAVFMILSVVAQNKLERIVMSPHPYLRNERRLSREKVRKELMGGLIGFGPPIAVTILTEMLVCHICDVDVDSESCEMSTTSCVVMFVSFVVWFVFLFRNSRKYTWLRRILSE